MAGKAEQAERVRDLTKQIAGIGSTEMPEIQFQMISPGREPVRVYAVEDGRPVDVPAYMLNSVMTKTLDDGRFMFVADPANAPEYKMGEVKCFLHPDSPMREMVDAVGLGGVTCLKATLTSEHSKRMHGQHRHKQEWAAVQEHIENQKEEKRDKRLDSQLDATLSIARGGSAAIAEQSGDSGLRYNARTETITHTPKGTCDICGKDGLKRVSAHKSMVHKEG